MIKTVIKNERGVSLVEVLIAVTIMSVISVSIMSYFVSASEKSSDQSRRVIAANFARMKAAQVRKFFADSTVMVPVVSGGTVPLYERFAAVMNNRKEAVTSNAVFSNLDASFSNLLSLLPLTSPYYNLFGAEPELNGTVYRYRVEFDNTAAAVSQLAIDMENRALDIPGDFLIKMTVTVYWTAAEVLPTEKPSAKFSTSIVTYIVKRGE